MGDRGDGSNHDPDLAHALRHAFTTTAITPLTTGAGASFVMGGDLGAATFFTGDIDSVRVYGHALQPAEIAARRTASDN